MGNSASSGASGHDLDTIQPAKILRLWLDRAKQHQKPSESQEN